jgi:hypothetical protein
MLDKILLSALKLCALTVVTQHVFDHLTDDYM